MFPLQTAATFMLGQQHVSTASIRRSTDEAVAAGWGGDSGAAVMQQSQ